MRRIGLIAGVVGLVAVWSVAAAQDMQHHHMHGPKIGAEQPQSGPAPDRRDLVRLPEPMQEHMLANMRDHLARSSATWPTANSTRRLKSRNSVCA